MRVLICSSTTGSPIAIGNFSESQWRKFIDLGGSWQMGEREHFSFHLSMLTKFLPSWFAINGLSDEGPKLVAELLMMEECGIRTLVLTDPVIDELDRLMEVAYGQSAYDKAARALQEYCFQLMGRFVRWLEAADAKGT